MRAGSRSTLYSQNDGGAPNALDGAVEEDERGSGAGSLVEDLQPVDVQTGHAWRTLTHLGWQAEPVESRPLTCETLAQ